MYKKRFNNVFSIVKHNNLFQCSHITLKMHVLNHTMTL